MNKLILIAVIITLGCNTTKKAAKKGEKAWKVYSTSPALIKRSVPLVSALYPCIVKNEIVRNDTTFLYVKDTIIEKIPYAIYKDKVLDTIVGEISILADSMGITVKYLGKEKIITKTKETIKIDQSEVNRLNDTLNVKEVAIANANGKNDQLLKELKEIESSKGKWVTYFWLLLFLVLILVGSSFISKFKRVVPLG
jgi:predicted RNA-binding protein with PUA domain